MMMIAYEFVLDTSFIFILRDAKAQAILSVGTVIQP